MDSDGQRSCGLDCFVTRRRGPCANPPDKLRATCRRTRCDTPCGRGRRSGSTPHNRPRRPAKCWQVVATERITGRDQSSRLTHPRQGERCKSFQDTFGLMELTARRNTSKRCFGARRAMSRLSTVPASSVLRWRHMSFKHWQVVRASTHYVDCEC